MGRAVKTQQQDQGNANGDGGEGGFMQGGGTLWGKAAVFANRGSTGCGCVRAQREVATVGHRQRMVPEEEGGQKRLPGREGPW